MAISLAVAFAYGSMIWGILPIKPGISWEGHLMGMLVGLLLAFWYRDRGPQRQKWSWEIEEEEEERLRQEEENNPAITYTYIDNKDDK